MARHKPAQATLDIRRYNVRCDGYWSGAFTVQAATPAAAKYRAFKQAREAGFADCFYAFLVNGVSVSEDRRQLRLGEIAPEIGL